MYDMLQLNMEIGMKTSHFNGNFVKKVYRICTSRDTIPTAEILSGKNARAFLVCGFFMKSFKKIS